MQCHIALDASGKQGSRKIMFGVAAVGYDDLAIEYHVIGIPVLVVWLFFGCKYASSIHPPKEKSQYGVPARIEIVLDV